MMLFIFLSDPQFGYWCNEKLSAHFNDCHFTVTQIRTGMPQKQLPVSPEKKKRRKKVKGKFRLVTKKFPACCKAAVLKLRESALLFQLPLISGPATSVDLLIDTPGFVFSSFLAGETSVLSQIFLWPSFHLCCIQTVKMEGVQPLDENVRNAPGLRFQTHKLMLVASVVQGLGLLLCLTYICLHFYAPQVPPQYPPIQSIKAQFTECDNEKGFILTSPNKEDTMEIQDNSIPIPCDGFYLISLKGYFSQELSLSLHYRKNQKPLFSHDKVTFVDSIIVASLHYKDKVYLNMTTHNTSCADIQVNGGELILIHQNPDRFCAK
ncbi:tumor necrosis factor ligand superfamily member 4 [Myotis lucifugus]|uniref:Tumor necrosis factor ligand superfamily member 4 n=2 Tax=Myotis lucifugus TaxID=59463 RepID=A0A0U5JAM4_MYOLU|nr:tumor necrosis factor ligand superfamily member 4 [Myotis lucifugus]CTQ86254.1 TPA: tumor necrosis factor ligand 2B [Myotis lucifugus]